MEIPKKLKVTKHHFFEFVECFPGDVIEFNSIYRGVTIDEKMYCSAIHYKNKKGLFISFVDEEHIQQCINTKFYKEVKDDFGYKEGLKHV